MIKKRILWCSEATYLSTGYAVYSREVLSRLAQAGKYEIAELACYCPDGHPYVESVPWKVYPVVPAEGTEERNLYDRHAMAQFGELRLEHVCLDFKPDILTDIRDYWMCHFENNSPFRNMYNWVIMPTCDSIPQHEQWLDTYSQADAVFSYQDWSGKVLQQESGGKIKYRGSASPAASPSFHPRSLAERKQLKSKLGLGPDIKLVGTVMRNQRRKLYPDLFKAFRQFLDLTKKKDVFLYCHVSYPDFGWDIPELIKQNGLSNYVYLTYICNACGYVHSTTFQDAGCVCPKCHNFSCSIASPHHGVSDEALNDIYNMFDLYVQYSCAEGFGVPLAESAAAGTPVCGTNYSAMEDVIPKLGGHPIDVLHLQLEVETGCNRAVPDNEDFVSLLNYYMNLPEPILEKKRRETRQKYEENYNWDWTAQKWMDVIDELEPRDWMVEPRINQPSAYNEQSNLSNYDYAAWLIIYVLGEPERLNTYFHTRIVRDLNYGMAMEGTPGLYYNDMAHKFHKVPNTKFNREIAYQKIIELANRRNKWEHERCIRLQNG